MTHKPDLLLLGIAKPEIVEQLASRFTVHPASGTDGADVAAIADQVEAIAVVGFFSAIDAAVMSRFPKLRIVSTMGVGYDHIDAKNGPARTASPLPTRRTCSTTKSPTPLSGC
jgi:lactate dehydrogenase-like 2-hydroxyacid dehydrogenase